MGRRLDSPDRPSSRGSRRQGTLGAPSAPAPSDFEVLLDSLGAVVWEADLETGRFCYVSRHAERLLGYPVERWLADPAFWVEHIHPEDRHWVPGFCRDATLRSESHEIEYRMLAADGRVVWLRDICSLVLRNGQAARRRGVMVDVTERRRADTALREASERLRTVIENAPVIFFALDQDGVVTLCEGRGLTAAGLDPAELVGRSVREWPRRTPRILSNLKRALAGEEFTARVDFEGRSYETRYTPVRDDHGGVAGVIGVATDVTERVQAEEQRRALEAQIRHTQKLESLGVLAGGIAHDFNNLLAVVLGNASLAAAEFPAGSPIGQNLGRIQRAAQRAADLTNQLLAYSGQGPLEIRAVDLSALVESMADLLRVSISKKARLECALDPKVPAVEGDSAQLTQVVLNLITNASEALGPETGAITVRTGVVRIDRPERLHAYLQEDLAPGPYVLLEVSDTGAGMSEETRARIFDPFYSTKFVGRGLGLATVLGIVRGHRGAVGVYSEPGQGTVVRVLLPCSGRAAEALPEPSGPQPAWRGQGLALVVDDEVDVREVAAELLGRLGFEVRTAGDGREGLEAFRSVAASVAVVLLDATMPEMSGGETARELRRIRSDIPLLLMSGFREEFVAPQLETGPRVGFVQKPFTPEQLATALRLVLEQES